MKLKYEAPEMDVKEFAKFENVFTYCNSGPTTTTYPGAADPETAPPWTCVDVTGTGDREDGFSAIHTSFASSSSTGGSGI